MAQCSHPYPVLERGCGVRVWAVASPFSPSGARRATSLAKPGYACTAFSGRASLPVASHAQSLLGLVGQCLRPASAGCGDPGPRLPSGLAGVDSGNRCPCGHVAAAQPWSLKQASGNRIGARCGYSGFLGLPSLSVVQNRSVPVSSLAQKPKPWQSHLLSPPFPAHSAASGTVFQVVLKNSFLQVCASAARAERSRGAALRGLRGNWVPTAR